MFSVEMLCGRRRNFVKRISLVTLQICLIISALVFIVLPLLFAYSVTLQRGILFLTFIKYPRNLDLSNPSSVGLYATRSFYVNVEEPEPDKKRIRIGVWHILPEVHANYFEKQLQVKKNPLIEHESKPISPNRNLDFEKLAMDYPVVKKENEVLFYENLLKMPGTIIIYLHGNTASRGSGHRLETYNMLRLLNYHIISIDYRGYGDSDPIAPTEEGVVRDALAVYEYITNLTSSPIFIWGHSLGTGVATHLCAQLNKLHIRGPRGLILESPFTNIRDEIKLHPLARPFKNLPWFDKTFSQPMYRNRLRFESDKHIASFPQPVMIIHAEDDYVVPFHLGYKLYRHALDIRNKSWGPIEFHRFDGIHKYGHKYLCRAPELPRLVETFVNSYRDVMF